MADTFTTRLRLRKPEIGANNNVWGPLLNEDGGSDRTEEAIVGIQSYALSGSKTLTSVNGELDEARMRVQNITGGTGGTITVPAVQGWWFVRAGSSGDVAVNNGSNSVAVKAGNAVPVLSDGTNIYQLRCLDFGADVPKSSGTPSGASDLANKAYVDSAISAAVFSGIAPGSNGQFFKTVAGVATWATFASADVTTALGYTPTSITGLTGTQSVSAIKTGLSLQNVDNTSDLGKPVSTATQTALNAKAALAANTFTGKQTVPASASGGAGLNLPHGSAPSAPGDGDLWTTTAGLFVRANGVTVGPFRNAEWTQIGSTLTTTSGSAATFSSIPATYDDLLIVIEGLSATADGTMGIAISDNSISWSSAGGGLFQAYLAGSAYYGSLLIPGYRKAAGNFLGAAELLSSDRTIGSTGFNALPWRLAAGIGGIRFTPPSGTFDAGTLKLFGR